MKPQPEALLRPKSVKWQQNHMKSSIILLQMCLWAPRQHCWALRLGCCVNVTCWASQKAGVSHTAWQSWAGNVGLKRGNERERDQRTIKALQGSSRPRPLLPQPLTWPSVQPETTSYSSGLDFRHSLGTLFESRMAMNPVRGRELSWLSSFIPLTVTPPRPDYLRPARFSAVITRQPSAGV